jgi:hypothetical protein
MKYNGALGWAIGTLYQRLAAFLWARTPKSISRPWGSTDPPLVAEVAAAEKINETYVGRVLRLTLLAPDIVEAILAGRQPPGLQLNTLLQSFPIQWNEHRHLLGEEVAASPAGVRTASHPRVGPDNL